MSPTGCLKAFVRRLYWMVTFFNWQQMGHQIQLDPLQSLKAYLIPPVRMMLHLVFALLTKMNGWADMHQGPLHLLSQPMMNLVNHRQEPQDSSAHEPFITENGFIL